MYIYRFIMFYKKVFFYKFFLNITSLSLYVYEIHTYTSVLIRVNKLQHRSYTK